MEYKEYLALNEKNPEMLAASSLFVAMTGDYVKACAMYGDYIKQTFNKDRWEVLSPSVKKINADKEWGDRHIFETTYGRVL